MRIKFFTILLLATGMSLVFGQERSLDSTAVAKDSVGIFSMEQDSLVKEKRIQSPAVIDSLWLETMYSSSLYEKELLTFEEVEHTASMEDIPLSTELLKERLEVLNERTP